MRWQWFGAGVKAVPGGSNLQIQYNNAGAFGGIPGSSWDGTTLTLPNAAINASNGGPGAVLLQIGTTAQTGFYANGTFVLNVAISASPMMEWHQLGAVVQTRLPLGGVFGWDTSGTFGGTIDLGLSKVSAGLLAVGNGAQADFSGSLKLTDLFTNNTNFLLRAGVALANGAAANTATLTNAPAAGNPTKWISIDDAGTTRRIPAW